MKKRQRHTEKGSGRCVRRALVWVIALLLTALAVYLLLSQLPKDDIDVDALLKESSSIPIETEAPETETEHVNPVPYPDIDEQLLTINDWSRPGTKTDAIEYVVVHYLGNPKTTAQQNHDYFESLKDLQDVSMSANFVVGLEGEIIECDDSGRFTEATYTSLVHLTAWLVCEYDLDREHIIRHYDVTGKECPLYYVEHEDKWEEFRDDVMNYIEECKEAKEK